MNKKVLTKINKENIFLLIYLLCTIFFYRMKDTKLTFQVMRIFPVIACICAIIQICINIKNKYYKINVPFILFYIFCIIAGCLFFHNRDTRIVIAIVGILACVGNINALDNFMRVVFWLQSFLVLMVFILCGAEGFGHKNAMALYLMILMYNALWLIRWEEKNIKEKSIIVCICFLWSIIVFMVTNCATALVFNIIPLIIIIIIDISVKCKNTLINICIHSYVIMTGFTLLFAFCYYKMSENYLIGNFILKLNELSSGRLDLMCYSMKRFGIKLIGGNLDFSAIDYTYGGYFHLDSGYMWILQELGCIILILFLVAFTNLMKKNKNNYMRLFILLVWALWGFSEDIFYSIGTNFMLLYIAGLLNNKDISIEKTEECIER